MLEDAERICAKASTLSRQLLTFADGGIPVRKTFAPGPLLSETSRLILHGSNVKIRVTAPGNLWPIEGDDAQFTQVLGNLLINAREAMPDGGTVWIQGENHALAEPMLHLPAGRYVRLTVRDDGPGIAAATLPRIFNPYFSSKARGSGLGLAIVHSVVRRHGGHIWAESTEGKGTLFTLLLPASDKSVPKRVAAGKTTLKTGKGRVLVMDDEAVVGDIARKILGRAGYTVSVELEGAAAVAAYRAALAAGKRFDAVILDLTVPGGMGGMEAAAEMLVLDPKASIILSSGYSKDDPGYSAFADGRVSFLAKPYTIEQLTRMVAKAIRSR
jgi:CheY-like chemotaxis protein